MAFSLLMLSALVASAYCGVLQPAGLGLVNAGLYNQHGFYPQQAVGLAKATPVGVVNQGFYAQPTVGLAKAAPVGVVNHGYFPQQTVGLVKAAPVGVVNHGYFPQQTVGLAKAAPVGVVNHGYFPQQTVGLAKAAPVGVVNQGYFPQQTVGLAKAAPVGVVNHGFYPQQTVGLAKAAPVGVVNHGYFPQQTVGLAKAAPVGVVNQGFYAQPAVAVQQPLAKVAQPTVLAHPVNAGFVNVQPSLAKVPAGSYGYPVNGFLNKAPAAFVQTPAVVKAPAAFVQTPAVVKTPAFGKTTVAVKQPVGFVAKASSVPLAANSDVLVKQPLGLGFGKLPTFAQHVPAFANNGLGFGSFKNLGFNNVVAKAPVKQVVNTFPSVKAPVVNTFVKQPVQTVLRAAPTQLTAFNKNLLPAHLPAPGTVVGVQSALGALPVGVNTLGYVQPKAQQVLPVAQFPVAQSFVKQPVAQFPVAQSFVKQPVAQFPVAQSFVKQPVAQFPVAKAPATFVSGFPKQALATKAVVVPQNVVPDVLNVPALSLQKTGASAGSPNSDFGDFAGFGIDGGFKLLGSDNKNIFGQF